MYANRLLKKKLKSYNVWQIWAKEMWVPYCKDLKCNNPWDKFVEEYYLWDFVDKNKQPNSFVEDRNLSNQVGIRLYDEDEIILAIINKCINLIIMRDYRIKNNITMEFDSLQRETCNSYKKEFLKNSGYDE